MKRRELLAYSVVTPLLTACGGGDPSSEPERATRRSAKAAAVGGVHSLGWDAGGAWTLDGVAFQFFGGEMHPARVPSQYWDHRIKMIKALGCNTISLYAMWNFHELSDGSFDFTSADRNLGHFIDLCAQNGMWVLLRPGPYVCAEWDFGGLPPRMLADPQYRDASGNLQIRGNFTAYMAAVNRWTTALYANVVRGRTLAAGGPIMLVAVENEYTYWSPDDANYPRAIASQWTALGYAEKFCVCDGSANGFKNNGIALPENTAYGMTADGASSANYATAAADYGVGVFGAECYPGWICAWGDTSQTLHLGDFAGQVTALAAAKRSFVLYVAHGGTNFGFTGGGNGIAYSGCQPVITSYDYGAPVSESGDPNPNFTPIRDAYVASASYSVPFATQPPAVPRIADGEVPAMTTSQLTFCALLAGLTLDLQDTLPQTIEWMAQTLNAGRPASTGVYPSGLAIYQAKLPGSGGNVTVTFDRAPDFAVVCVNGSRVSGLILSTVKEGALARAQSFTIANAPANANLQIICMPFGRSNYNPSCMNVEGRGLSRNVYANGVALTGWSMTLAPLSAAQLGALAFSSTFPGTAQPFFARATVTIASPKDLYIDMSAWGSGYVFVNGRNLGRYWTKAGPQKRLYCPGAWLNAGNNTIVVFECTQESAGGLAFFGASGLPLNITHPSSTAAVPPLTSGASYFLQNVNSGLYLDVMPPVAGTSNTSPGQAPFSGAASQGWRAAVDASGGLTFTNLGTGTALDVAGHARTAGSVVILYAANGGANQSWMATGVSQGAYTLAGRESQLLLDVSEQSKSATSLSPSLAVAAIVIRAPAGNERWPFSQQWRMVPAVLDQGIYTLTLVASDLLLGTYQAATAQGSRLAIAAATGNTEQQWQLLAVGDGSWRLKNVKSGQLMDVTSGGTANSSSLEIWPDNGGSNQRFALAPRPDGKSFALKGVPSGRVVDANGSGASPTSYGSSNVSALTLWDDNGGANQSWIFAKVG